MYTQVYFASLKDFFNKFVQQPEVVIAQLARALGDTQKAHAFATEFVQNVAKDRVKILTGTLRPMIEAFDDAKGLDLNIFANYGKAIATYMPKFSGALKVNELKRIPFAGDVDRMAGGAPKGAWAWEKAVMRNCAAEVNGTL